MTFAQQVNEAINTIIDVCAYHEGNQCKQCEAQRLCNSVKPLDLLVSNNSNTNTTNGTI